MRKSKSSKGSHLKVLPDPETKPAFLRAKLWITPRSDGRHAAEGIQKRLLDPEQLEKAIKEVCEAFCARCAGKPTDLGAKLWPEIEGGHGIVLQNNGDLSVAALGFPAGKSKENRFKEVVGGESSLSSVVNGPKELAFFLSGPMETKDYFIGVLRASAKNAGLNKTKFKEIPY